MSLPNLTFGIELEFLCLRPRASFPDPHDNVAPNTVTYAIAIALMNRGIPATGWEDPDGPINDGWPPFSRWRVGTDELRLSEEEAELLPGRPDGDDDDETTWYSEEGWVAESVELSSRKFSLDGDDWRSEIQAVLQVLREVEAQGCRFITNKSTGFHIHVGNGNEKIPLRTCKNVFQLATAFERCFDELHTVSRVEWPVNWYRLSSYYPPSFFHTYGKLHNPRGRSPGLFDRLAAIEGANTYGQLGELFSIVPPGIEEYFGTSGHNSAYNFDNLFPDEEGMGRYAVNLTKTIEFRQHAGTLDFLSIVSWVLLTTHLVRWCSADPPFDHGERMIELLLHAVDPDCNLEELLRMIDCPAEAADHYLDGGIIGHLAASNAALPVAEQQLDLVMAQNDLESSERSDRDLVQGAIRRKYEAGIYGLYPNIRPDLSHTTVAAELEKAWQVLDKGLPAGDCFGEKDVSEGRRMVFETFTRSCAAAFHISNLRQVLK